MRTDFYFVVFADIAVEMNKFFFGFADCKRTISPCDDGEKTFEFRFVVLFFIVRIGLIRKTFIGTLDLKIERLCWCLPSPVLVGSHPERQDKRDTALWLDCDLVDPLYEVGTPEGHGQVYCKGNGSTVILYCYASLKSLLAFGINAVRYGNGKHRLVRFQEYVTRQPDLLTDLFRHLAVDFIGLTREVSDDHRSSGCHSCASDYYPFRHSASFFGIADSVALVSLDA